VKKLFNMSGTTYDISTKSRGVFSVGKCISEIVGLSKWVDWMDAAWCGGFAAGQDSERQALTASQAQAKRMAEAVVEEVDCNHDGQMVCRWCDQQWSHYDEIAQEDGTLNAEYGYEHAPDCPVLEAEEILK
jgi:hypothetical protein